MVTLGSMSVIKPALLNTAPLLSTQSMQLFLMVFQPNTRWLNRLNASMRNCNMKRSVRLKFFMMEASVVNDRGPYGRNSPSFRRTGGRLAARHYRTVEGVKNVT